MRKSGTRLLSLFLLLAAAHSANAQEYWPLQTGSRWELQSGGATMAYEVIGRSGETFQVKWDNPWVKATFGFRVSGAKILLDSLDMGQGVMTMPPDTAYFDFSKNPGESWSNVLGTMTVLRKSTVNAPAGKYENAVTIRARDTKKTDTFWTFAPGVGPVQFGQGRDAFLLKSFRPGGGGSGANAEVSRRREPAPPDNTRYGRGGSIPVAQRKGGVYIGIDANPAPPEGYADDAKLKRAGIARQAGASFLYYAPKWNELEPKEGKFNFAELDHKATVSKTNNWPISLNLRVVDTNNRSMPSFAQKRKFDDERNVKQFRSLLAEIAPRFDGRVRWLQIGNEVNEYFKNHRGELEAYRRFLEQVLPDAKRLFPEAAFSVNFTFFAAPALNEYQDLLSLCDFVSFTYYPLAADLTFRPPSEAAGDFNLMLRAAGSKPVFLQEVGYSSAERLHSSEDQQAQFIRTVFHLLRQHRDRIFAAHFVWMSDLPNSVVESFTKYYKMGNSENFKAYLASLGYFDKQGKPKKAWQVFAEEAPKLGQSSN